METVPFRHQKVSRYGLRLMGALLFASLMLCSASAAQGAPYYYRFWRGWKAERLNNRPLSGSEFRRQLNQVFIPTTVNVGKGKGLAGYLPALPLTRAQSQQVRKRGIDIPDEVALVVYRSQSAYDELRNTPEGKAYQQLHRVYFDMPEPPSPAKSRTLVPERFGGSIEIEKAYDVLGSEKSWRAAPASGEPVTFVLHERRRGVSDADYTAQVGKYVDALRDGAQKQGLQSYLTLVSKDYWIDYQLWKAGSDVNKRLDTASDLAKGVSREAKRLSIRPLPVPSSGKLQFGGAVNTQY